SYSITRVLAALVAALMPKPPILLLLALCLLRSTVVADQLIDMGLDLPKRGGIADRVSMVKLLTPNTKTVYANLDGPGVIRHIWVTPCNVFEGNRQTIIRIYFDDAKVPNVEAPIGDFFGVMHGREYYDINSVFLSVKAWEGYACYFPMPFAK